MKFRVLNAERAMSYEEDARHIFISIGSPDYHGVTLPANKNRVSQLYLYFHDLDTMPTGTGIVLGCSKPYKLFTDEMAKKVWRFVNRHKDVEAILCNCQAGISRSAGMIAGIKKALGYDDADIFKKYLPNRLVYRKVVENSGSVK